MNTIGSGPAFTLLRGIHALSIVVFAVGVLFLVLWAIRHLTPSQLRTWGIGLAIGGSVACLITIGVRGGPWGGAGNLMHDGDHMTMMKQMMNMMDDNDMDMHDSDDMMNMSMDDMAAMLEGKTGDDFDRAFIEGMIPHHQGAIDMAKAAKTAAGHQEIMRMADDIIEAQQREIDMMKGWQRAWGYTE